MHNHFGIEIFPPPLGMLYNILLPINQYSGNNAINTIMEAMSGIRESQWSFHQIISSNLKVIGSATYYCIRIFLDISNPNEYADICY